MKSLRVSVLSLLVLALTAGAIPGYAELPELIPRDILFGNPERAMVEISPDGKKLSYVASNEGIMNVWVKAIGEEKDRQVTFDTTRGIIFYEWTADSKRILYLQDQEGNENYHLYGVNLKSGKVTDYTPFENVRVNVVAFDDKHPKKWFISMNKRNPQIFDVYLLDLRNGKIKPVAENPGNILMWVADWDFKLRGALAVNQEGEYDLLVRDDEKSDWRTVLSWEFEDTWSSYPLSFTPDGNHIYLEDSRNANATRLVKLGINTGEIEVIAEDPQYDVGPAMFHPETGEVLGVSFLKDKRERVFFDEEVKADFEIINQLEDGEAGLADWTQDYNKWLISFNKDDGPIPYYLYDRETKEARFLFSNRPELAEYTLAKMEPITFTARDSLTIHGYITFPPGLERKNLPMVLKVHGGPWVRDYWGYAPGAQWLANRGYICLQVNYRGSNGYGKEFLNAGNKEWGRKMHYDLVDAVNWAIDKGYADPERIAIYGGSYGGYAALVGATFTPDLFACAVDMFGPSNLITDLEAAPPYWKLYQELMYRRIGHPVKDSALLWERSPLSRVDSIRIPMLIAQGANDPRVKQSESNQIVAAMEEKGIDYEYMLFEDEGHGFMKEDNRLEFYAAAEKFLAKHLGGRYEK
ncbi:S9 family peptidase [candidate division TA06 bacterium B3_TA06]|uniref:S9 family peptidase n=1 Tax=candidate division TA06 bacterium B3_TA06 TaxID=2012487 RepID=A0A532V6U0_UNCT6|nr:MAG: S9 family peptidase [candidate division TA06 bacterium B3_TA06]